MLIVTPIQKGDVVTLRIDTGEEIIARFSSDNDTAYEVKQPKTLILNPEREVALNDFLLTANQESVTISKNKVVAVAKTKDEIKNAYLKTVTGLTLV